MLISNTVQIPTYRSVDYLGPVNGVAAGSQEAIEIIFGSTQTGLGSNFASRVALTASTSDEALSRQGAYAHQIGANGIIWMYYSFVEIMPSVTEFLACATGIKIEKIEV
jgi:uncharacterized protein YbjQ (UPF0145 family)